MRRSRRIVLMAGSAAVLIWGGLGVAAQGATAFSARLGLVPTTVGDRADVTGRGRARAELSGMTLTIDGDFEGLAAPATKAELGEGFAQGARGYPITELTITKAASGTISGSATLTAQQVEHLQEGRLYVQVYSEKGIEEDGSNLMGWFLP